jgi:hypothetical protein
MEEKKNPEDCRVSLDVGVTVGPSRQKGGVRMGQTEGGGLVSQGCAAGGITLRVVGFAFFPPKRPPVLLF